MLGSNDRPTAICHRAYRLSPPDPIRAKYTNRSTQANGISSREIKKAPDIFLVPSVLPAGAACRKPPAKTASQE
jgi:hypothetical protein